MSNRSDWNDLVGLTEKQAKAIGKGRAAHVCSYRLILMIAQQLRYLTDQLYRVDGLTTRQAAVLTIVSAQGCPTHSDVAHAMLSTHQNVKQLVTVLIRKGFLRVISDQKDARVRRLVTTAKNERYWAKRNPEDFDRVDEWFGGLSREETRQLCVLLTRLQIGLKNHVASRSTRRIPNLR